jgi:hypothetical protein
MKTAVEQYLASVEAIVQRKGNIWNCPEAQVLGRLYLDALSEGTHSMHELLGLVWGLYKKHGLRVDGNTKEVMELEEV